MRAAAQTKMGFYPIPDPVIRMIATWIGPAEDPRQPKGADGHRPPVPAEEMTIGDPCAGEGLALKALADILGVPYRNCFACELDDGRAFAIRDNLPGVIQPVEKTEAGEILPVGCGIESLDAPYNKLSLLYLNPPFDDQLGGGGREELQFLLDSVRFLRRKGVLIFVCPMDVLTYGQSASKLRDTLDAMFEDMELFKFPEDHRKYGEVVLFGVRRQSVATEDERYDAFFAQWFRVHRTWSRALFPADRPAWGLPFGDHPRYWRKSDYTQEELLGDLSRSPLQEALDSVEEWVPPRPPLPLFEGHLSLMLASGFLDGAVYPEGERPHVVRGLAIKERELAGPPEEGPDFTKSTEEEDIKMTVRVVQEPADGEPVAIMTYTN